MSGLGFEIAPGGESSEFEARISRQAVYDNDKGAVFSGERVGVVIELINSSWALVDRGPQGGVTYDFVELAPLNPGPLRVRLVGGEIELTWPGSGVLESRDSLSGGAWAPVAAASSPHRIMVSGKERYYRLRQ